MLYHKKGLPQEGDLVVCTVSKIQHHSVFVNLDHYGKSAILHISEVSPGRIRNLRDYVQEGKVIVCKTLAINPTRGHIDVSLRRVNDNQRIKLINKIKKEKNAEKVVEFFCEEKKLDVKKTYQSIYDKLSGDYEFLHEAFTDFVKGDFTLPKFGFKPADEKLLVELIEQRIKPPQVELTGKFKIVSFANDGVEIIKKTLIEAGKVDKDHLVITYNGGGNYNYRIVTEHFKQAEDILSQAQRIVEKEFADSKRALYEFVKNDGKQLS